MLADEAHMPQQSTKVASFKKRYAFKLLIAIMTTIAGIVTNAIVPRALGPLQYGYFTFLQNLFTSIIGFIDAGSSTCFFAKLSRQPDDNNLIRFYSRIVYLVFAVLLSIIVIAYICQLDVDLWKGISLSIVLPMSILAFSAWLNDLAVKIIDAKGLTVQGELIRFIHKIVVVAALLLMALCSVISLGSYIAFQLTAWILLLGCLWFFLVRMQPLKSSQVVEPISYRKYANNFWLFLSPLLVATCISHAGFSLESWLLLHFSGPVEQGFFGLSFQISIVITIFSSALVPLLMREFSHAAAKNDIVEVTKLFSQAIKSLYAFSVTVAVFLAVQADRLTLFFGGEQYKEATFAVALMLLYPAHQTYGQIANTMFLAVDRPRTYRNLSICTSVVSLVVAFFFVAPASFGGLFLGAIGQALKFILVQVVMTNISVYFCAKYCGVSFRLIFWHQTRVTVLVLFFACLSRWIVEMIYLNDISSFSNQCFSFLLSGIFFAGPVLLLFRFYPDIFGISHSQLMQVSAKIRGLGGKNEH